MCVCSRRFFECFGGSQETILRHSKSRKLSTGLVNLVQDIQIFGISRDVDLIINACASVLFSKSLGLWYTNNIFMTDVFFLTYLCSQVILNYWNR